MSSPFDPINVNVDGRDFNFSPTGPTGYAPYSVASDQSGEGGGGGGGAGGMGGGGGGAQSTANQGMYAPGWQYPIDDPGKALRNYLRQNGQLGNPYNQSWVRLQNQMAASLLPQFYAKSLSESAGGQDMGLMEDQFGKFIGARVNGTLGPMGMNEAQSAMGQLNALLRQFTDASMGVTDTDPLTPGNQLPDMGTPEGRAAMLKHMQTSGGMGMNPLQLAIAGNLTDPQEQAALFLSAYLPALGSGLSKGLSKAIAPQVQSWDDYFGALAGPTNRSLLDILVGSFGTGGMGNG